MSNKRISELPLEVTPKLSDSIVLASDGVSKRTSIGNVLNVSHPATFGNTIINGDLDVNGNLRVSTLVSASIIYESGSTIFGNSSDDIHKFTGSLNITGSTNQIGNVVTIGNTTMTGSLNITGSIQYPEWIDFKTLHATPANVAGRLTWNDTDGTLNVGLKGGSVTLQVGQEQVVRVVNKTGADLLESQYKVVRVRTQAEGGAQGQRLAVVNALATNEINSATTLGIVTENISQNQEGFITTFGLVRDINTSGTLQGETWQDGDTLYLSATTPGGLTKYEPISPNHLVIMGYVVYAHNNQGKIFVKVDNGYELDELHNIHIYENTLVGNAKTTGGSTLYYSGSVWTNNENVRFTETNAILARVSSSLNFANDTAAAAGGVPLGGLYRNGNVIQIRLV